MSHVLIAGVTSINGMCCHFYLTHLVHPVRFELTIHLETDFKSAAFTDYATGA